MTRQMNIHDLVAIDIHTHAEVSTKMLPDEAEKEAMEARRRYFRYEVQHPTIAQMADYYRAFARRGASSSILACGASSSIRSSRRFPPMTMLLTHSTK